MVRRQRLEPKQKLSQAWAKSDGTSIREHTDKLLENLRALKGLYRAQIEEACPEEFRKYLWQALELACEYHDYGKLHCKFQKEVGNKDYPDQRVERVRHNLLSPAFLEVEEEFLRDVVALAILHHHEPELGEEAIRKVEGILRQEFNLSMASWHKGILQEDEYTRVEKLSKFYSFDKDRLRAFYVLLKGLLLRIDHASSNKEIERIEVEPIESPEKDIREKKGFELNDLQEFVLQNRDKSLVVSAPTGYGKTEAGFIFLQGKGFYTIPIRTSANAIYRRAKEYFGERAGLLHSTALNFLVETEGDRNKLMGIISDYEYAKHFSKALLVCTPDQLFPFVFAYRGFEKSLAVLSYSAVVIDEVQLFEPHTLGFLVEGIKIARELGSRVMVMTATLPEFMKRDLEGMEHRYFGNPEVKRHRLRVEEKSLLSAVDDIRKRSQEGKVLVITNTVKRAVELYEKLKEQGLEVNLLHSRYILKDRREKEEEIKEFFDKGDRGIRITTQLAEVSLDLDADYLFTEYSTPDSLFQRLGRVNRKGQKPTDEPNAFVFLEDCSGIGPVYRKSLHESTKEKLRDGLWSEEDKRRLIEEVYSEENLSKVDRKYLEDYKKAKDYIRDVWNTLGLITPTQKSLAQKLFRDIHSITVIPEVHKEELKVHLEVLKESKDKIERIQAINNLLDYTFSIPAYQMKTSILEKIPELQAFDIYWLKTEYDPERGLFELPKDPELYQESIF